MRRHTVSPVAPSSRRARSANSKAQLITASTFSVLAFTALAFAHDQLWQLAAAAAVFGAGLGLALTSLMNLIVTSVPASQTGVASGMNANFRTIGGEVGAALMGSIVTANLQPDGLPTESGHTTGFLLLAGISVAAVIDLDHVRWQRDNGNPVLVSHVDSTSFTFLTLPGHFRGPGRTIQFTILERDGRLILRQVGATSQRISDLAYDGGAWLSWRTQAATLRSALVSDAHGPDVWLSR